MWLKQRLIRGSGSLMPGGGRGTVVIIGMRGEPAVAEAGVTLQQPEAHHVCSPREVVPGSWDPGSGRLHRLPGVGMDSDLRLHTGSLVAAAAALVFHARLWCLS